MQPEGADHTKARKRPRETMAAPSDDALLVAVLQAKEANPDFGMARIRALLKDENGWELSEKRVKRALAELAEGKQPAGATAAAAQSASPAATASDASPASEAGAGAAGSWAVERPSPRGYFSLTAVEPSTGQGGVVMFGGELFDNSKNLFFNQLYRLDAQSQSWSRFTSGNSPPARSAHQACVCAGYYWVFGGEFSSPTGSKFKLMDDLWKMPLSEKGQMSGSKWQKVAGGGGTESPGPRSGHRMVAVGNFLVLYGGMGESKYYSDLHVWDTLKGAWISKMVKMQQMKLGKDAKTPGPRGGFAMWPDGDSGVYIWGGTRDKGRNDQEYLDDLWRLDTSTWAWERVAAPGGPGVRSGPAVAVVGAGKRQVVFFGGVVDVETAPGGKGKPQQKFLADMLCYDMDARAWVTPAGAAASEKGASAAADTGAATDKVLRPGPRRNAQAVFLSSSGSLLLVGGLRDDRTQGASRVSELDSAPAFCAFPPLLRVHVRSSYHGPFLSAHHIPAPAAQVEARRRR